MFYHRVIIFGGSDASVHITLHVYHVRHGCVLACIVCVQQVSFRIMIIGPIAYAMLYIVVKGGRYFYI